MISIACTHLSSVKFVGTSKYMYSTVPRAGTWNSSGNVNTASGAPISQPLGKLGVAGIRAVSPRGAPAASERATRRMRRYLALGETSCDPAALLYGRASPMATRAAAPEIPLEGAEIHSHLPVMHRRSRRSRDRE